MKILCNFDRASSLICRNKMPTRCNRGFYCRSYCLLNMFRAPLCPSSGAQEYYTVVAVCGIWCCGFQVVGLVWSWELCVQFPGCCKVSFVFIWEQTATCATYSINWLVFIIEMKSVYSAVRTGSLNKAVLQHKLIGFYNRDEKCLQRGTDWGFK